LINQCDVCLAICDNLDNTLTREIIMKQQTHDQGMHVEAAGAGSNWSTLRTLFVELLAHRARSA
jgi:hypothetical protein